MIDEWDSVLCMAEQKFGIKVADYLSQLVDDGHVLKANRLIRLLELE